MPKRTLLEQVEATGSRVGTEAARILMRVDAEYPRSLRLACEFGFRQGEKGHNLERTMQLFDETVK